MFIKRPAKPRPLGGGKRLLTHVRQAYLRYLLERIAAEWNLVIVEMEVMEDHVHLFVEAPPRYSSARPRAVTQGGR